MDPQSLQFNILYVDDEPQLLEICKAYLEHCHNFHVETTLSAKDAISILQHQHFDAIICDFQMPGMNGIEFLKAVRTQFGDIPYILFTAQSREEVVIHAITSGADFYVQKGGEIKSQFAELAHKVHQAIRCHKAEQDYQKSEDRFSKIFHASSIQEILIDAISHRIIEVNDSFLCETGYSRNEILGRTWDELGLITDSLQREELNGVLKQQGFFRNVEIQIQMKSGERRTVLMSWASIETVSQNVIISQSIDITDQIAAKEEVQQKTGQLVAAYNQLTAIQEELQKNFITRSKQDDRLQKSETEERMLMNASPDLVCLHDLNGKIFAINEAFAQEIGKPVSYLTGKNIYRHTFPALVVSMRFLSENAILRKEPVTDSFEKDGRIFDIRVVPEINPDETSSRVVFIARDVTLQKQLKDDLFQAEAKNRELVATLPAIISSLNIKDSPVKELLAQELSRLAVCQSPGLINGNHPDND